MNILITVFLIGCHAVVVTCVPYCSHKTNERIQQCVQPVAQFAKVLNQQETSNTSRSSQSELGQAISLPKLGGQVFKELCRLIRNFGDCVAEHRKQCPKHITISLIDASYGFLCNEGYDTFMTSAECLMELDQKPAVKHCHDETLADIEEANKQAGISMPVKLDRMCDALNFFSGCVRQPIRHNCGVAAWAVIFRVLRDTTNTLMPACQFTGQSHRHHHSTQPPPTTPRSRTHALVHIAPEIVEVQGTERLEPEPRSEEGSIVSGERNSAADVRSGDYRNVAPSNELSTDSMYFGSRKAPQRYEQRNEQRTSPHQRSEEAAEVVSATSRPRSFGVFTVALLVTLNYALSINLRCLL